MLYQLLDLRPYVFFDLRFHFVRCHLLFHSCAYHRGLLRRYHPSLHCLGILFSSHFLTGCLQHSFQDLLLRCSFHCGPHLFSVCLHLRTHNCFHLSGSRLFQGSWVELRQHAVERGSIVFSGQLRKRNPGSIQPRSSQLLIGCIQHGSKQCFRAGIERFVVGNQRCQAFIQRRGPGFGVCRACSQGNGSIRKRCCAILQFRCAGGKLRRAISQRSRAIIQLGQPIVQFVDFRNDVFGFSGGFRQSFAVLHRFQQELYLIHLRVNVQIDPFIQLPANSIHRVSAAES